MIGNILKKAKMMMEGKYYFYHKMEDGTFMRKICVYNRYLSDAVIKDIFNDIKPRKRFKDILDEWAEENGEIAWQFIFDDVYEVLDTAERKFFKDNIKTIREALSTLVAVKYDPNDFSAEILFDIGLDTGDANSEYLSNNILYCYKENKTINEDSSLLWLCRQQGKEKELIECLENDGKTDDKFISSVYNELNKLPSKFGCLTFLVKMQLQEAFDFVELIDSEMEQNCSPYVWERTGTKSIILDKSTCCGLVNLSWGYVSVLDIQLDNDVILPLKFINEARVDQCSDYTYSIKDLYKASNSLWSDTLKAIA